MKHWAITNPREAHPCIFIGKERPGFLAMGERGQLLPLFATEEALRTFIRRCRAGEEKYFGALPLGLTYFEVEEAIRPAVKAGKIKTLVFDPILDRKGKRVGEALEWDAKDFSKFIRGVRSKVMEIARRDFDVPTDEQPSSEVINDAYIWYIARLLDYLINCPCCRREVGNTEDDG
jgi:hypothetical protein